MCARYSLVAFHYQVIRFTFIQSVCFCNVRICIAIVILVSSDVWKQLINIGGSSIYGLEIKWKEPRPFSYFYSSLYINMLIKMGKQYKSRIWFILTVTTQLTGQDCCNQVGACVEGTEVKLNPVLKSQQSVGDECFYPRTWNTLNRGWVWLSNLHMTRHKVSEPWIFHLFFNH